MTGSLRHLDVALEQGAPTRGVGGHTADVADGAVMG
jgi:hypothetical protein